MTNPNRLSVEIIAATERDQIRAAALLIFTKHTRLEMNSEGFEGIVERCIDDRDWMIRELEYMSATIRSSWEFLDVTFAIGNVSRAAAQQITRTRFTPIDGDLFGSYAMQSQRVTNMSGASWHNPIFDRPEFTTENIELESKFDEYARFSVGNYTSAMEAGMTMEEARGLLPMNLNCNLIAKYNLRVLVELIQARTSYRAQGEFQALAAEMRTQLVGMWPWASIFLKPRAELAKGLVEELRAEIKGQLVDSSRSLNSHKLMILLSKIDDQLQGGK